MGHPVEDLYEFPLCNRIPKSIFLFKLTLSTVHLYSFNHVRTCGTRH